ncbi:MAG: SLC5 family protein [Pseudomonadota bacterium]
MANPIQLTVFVLITALIGFLTWLHCRAAAAGDRGSGKDYFLANGGLSWYFIAGSITLTNLSTDQLVSMNGSQMLLIAWWELAAVVGLFVLAFVFLPIYYRNNCTTTTELLQRKYNDKHIRALISVLFLLGNLFIFLPAILYGGSLFLKSMTGLDASGLFGERVFVGTFLEVDSTILVMSLVFAAVGAAYAILGGLRAVAVSDTYSGILILSLALLLVFLSLKAIGFDLSGIPKERLTLIGREGMFGADEPTPIPWHTLLTGMIFIQTFYWSTNQTITQRAMAAPNLDEARKGVLAAAGIRLMIVPIIVTLPGIIAFKLYGDINDAAYGRIVGDILPVWLSGAFAAALAAAVLTTFNSILNASAALYVCDLHEAYVGPARNVPKLSGIFSISITVLAILIVPFFASQTSIINTVQKLYGLLSMPILSAFIVGLAFRNVDARAAIIGVVSGVIFYASFIFGWQSFHEIHGMALTLLLSVTVALTANRLIFGHALEGSWQPAAVPAE